MLGLFLKYKKVLPKKDIRSYDSVDELEDAIEAVSELTLQKVDPSKVRGAHLFARDERGSIWVPDTESASCILGAGTKWCTAKYGPNDKRNLFSEYQGRGNLYIYFDNKLLKRFQAFVGKNGYHELRDERMRPVDHVPFRELLEKNGVFYDPDEDEMGDDINLITIT